MSTALQNRLVGTIILVALAVIFLPDILDGKKQTNKDLFVEIPQRPVMRTVENPPEFPEREVEEAATRKVELVDEPPLDDDSAPVAGASTNDTEEDTASTEQPPPLEAKSVDRSLQQQTVVENDDAALLESAGWVVQLGVFRHQKNVRDLLDKLRAAGYRAFSRQIQTSSGELTKVFIGPDLQKENLEAAMPHLKELTNLQGRVTPFTVN